MMSTQTAYRSRNVNASPSPRTIFGPNSGPSTYTLLNDEGEPQEGYYILMNQWPSPENQVGKAVYVDEDGSNDELRFSLDPARRVFRTHHVRAPNHHFDVKPLIVGDEVIELRMDLGNNDIATFVLHPENYEAPPELGDGTGEALITIVELAAAPF